jgi:hypothetical protein
MLMTGLSTWGLVLRKERRADSRELIPLLLNPGMPTRRTLPAMLD